MLLTFEEIKKLTPEQQEELHHERWQRYKEKKIRVMDVSELVDVDLSPFDDCEPAKDPGLSTKFWMTRKVERIFGVLLDHGGVLLKTHHIRCDTWKDDDPFRCAMLTPCIDYPELKPNLERRNSRQDWLDHAQDRIATLRLNNWDKYYEEKRKKELEEEAEEEARERLKPLRHQKKKKKPPMQTAEEQNALFRPEYWVQTDHNLSWAETILGILDKLDPLEQPYLFIAQNTERWAELRRYGSSSFANYANVWGAYMSRSLAYTSIINKIPTRINYWMERGQRLEPVARDSFIKMFSDYGRFYPVGIVICEDDSRLSCSPDGLWLDSRTNLPWVVEFKVPAELPYEDIPTHHIAQLLGNMYITKIPRLLYAVYTESYPLRVWACEFHQGSWDELYFEVCQFLSWVEEKQEPPTPKRGSKLHFPNFPHTRDIASVIPGFKPK